MKSSVCIMVAQHLSTQLRSTSAHYFWTIADDILRPPVNIWVADNVLGTINLGGHQPLSLDFTRMASGHHQQRGGGDSIDLKKGFSITLHTLRERVAVRMNLIHKFRHLPPTRQNQR